jgi:hypothetical protein
VVGDPGLVVIERPVVENQTWQVLETCHV